MIQIESEYVFNLPLYKEEALVENSLEDLKKLHFFFRKDNETTNVDCYCKKCEKESVFIRGKQEFNLGFRIQPPDRTDDQVRKDLLSEDIFITPFLCTRNKSHKLDFVFVIRDQNLIKIGQYPSIADIEIENFKRYGKILDNESIKELNKSIGLASHGIGIGSFIYLRRIIEKVIEDSHFEAKKMNNWDDEIYQRARIIKRIKLLKEFLPEVLVENASLYSILSKGIHELDEKECLAYFPTLRDIVFFILEEKLSNKRKRDLKNKIKVDISNINKQIST